MAEIADDGLNIHRDDRLVLDDQHIGERLPLDLFERFGDEIVYVLWSGPDQIGCVFRRETFKRSEE